MAKGLAWPSTWNHEIVSSVTTFLKAIPGMDSVNYLSARHVTTIGLRGLQNVSFTLRYGLLLLWSEV